MAGIFTWSPAETLSWLNETEWGEAGPTPDEALEAVEEEEVDGAFLEENDAHEPDIWTDLGFSQVQAELLAVDVVWARDSGKGSRPSGGANEPAREPESGATVNAEPVLYQVNPREWNWTHRILLTL